MKTNKSQKVVFGHSAFITSFCLICWQPVYNIYIYVCVCETLHHEMSRNVPEGHFHFFYIFSESTFFAIYNGENHFQIRELVAELHVFEYGGTTFGTFEKACFKC